MKINVGCLDVQLEDSSNSVSVELTPWENISFTVAEFTYDTNTTLQDLEDLKVKVEEYHSDVNIDISLVCTIGSETAYLKVTPEHPLWITDYGITYNVISNTDWLVS